MLAGDWAHRRRVQQYHKTDYLSAVAQSSPHHQERLITAEVFHSSLVLKTTQASVLTHTHAHSHTCHGTPCRYAAHARYVIHMCQSGHASTHTDMNTHVRIPCTHQHTEPDHLALISSVCTEATLYPLLWYYLQKQLC